MRIPTLMSPRAAWAACALLIAPLQPAQKPAGPVELLIRNGTVVDGTGAPRFRADVAVRGGRIVHIGQLADTKPLRTIAADNLIVAPGFIDVHTHADDLPLRPSAENFVRMGVTSVVGGNCGISAPDVGALFGLAAKNGLSINLAVMVGHNTVREAVMGRAERAPTPDELARMKALVAAAMQAGAVGFSSGLEYVPGVYAKPDELIELAKVAGGAGGLYASHMRNEGVGLIEAVEETIAVGEAAHCPVQISHVKVDSPVRWGSSTRVLDLIDAARRRGVAVRADQYAYTAGSSSLSIRFPPWSLEGGHTATLERLAEPATWERIKDEMKGLLAERGFKDLSWAVIASYKETPELNGLSLEDAAQRRLGRSDLDAQLELAREIMRKGGAQMVYHFSTEDDVTRFMRHPEIMIASDGRIQMPGQDVPHPRSYGNNARVLGRYVREMKVISLEEAVRKMTSLPAAQFGFERRGAVREGYAADLVVFDAGTIRDLATFERPHQYAAGIAHVLVNGVPVLLDGQMQPARPGQILRRGVPERMPMPAVPVAFVR